MNILRTPVAVKTRDLVAIVAPLLLTACGGGCYRIHGHCAPPPPPPPTLTFFGYVAGLTGSGLTLSYNGGAPVAIMRNGATTLATNVTAGTEYSVAITNQPTNPAQTCTISNPSGTVTFSGMVDIAVSALVYCPRAVAAWAFVATAGSITTTPGVASVPGSLSTYAIDAASGALMLVPGSTVLTGPAVSTVQGVPRSPYLWVVSIGDSSAVDQNTVSSVYVYTANAGTGLLTANAGNPFFTLNGTSTTAAACNGTGGPGSTTAITFAPSGAFGYDLLTASPAANNGGSYVFTVSSGAPQLSGVTVSNACITPTTVDPSGQFAYYGIAEAVGAYSLSAATVDPTTGALTAVSGQLFPESAKSTSVTDPFGQFVYELSGPGGNFIYGQTINPVSGVVTDIGGMPITLPAGAISLVISPDGQFAYVAASGGLYTYSIAGGIGGGALTLMGSPVALQIAAGPVAAALGVTTSTQIDPSGQFLYVSASAGSGQQGIYAYRRDASTGALTLVSGSPFAVTSQTVPLQLALH